MYVYSVISTGKNNSYKLQIVSQLVWVYWFVTVGHKLNKSMKSQGQMTQIHKCT